MPRATLEVFVDSKGNVQAVKGAGKEIENLGEGAKKSGSQLGGLVKAARLAVSAMGALKSAQAAVEFVKLGAQVQTARHRFEAFAGGTDQARAYLDAFARASDNTVDRMSAMQGATKMLQMGLVDNADEMEIMAAVAIKLGDQTQAAGNRIADFSALLANRSIPRLDNFGMSSARVRERVEELKKAGYDLDQAFKLAVLEEGRKSLGKLGDTSEELTTKIGKLEAAFADAKAGTAEFAAEMVDDVLNVDKFTERLRLLPDYLRQVWTLGFATTNAMQEFKQSLYLEGPVKAAQDAMQRFRSTVRLAVIDETKTANEQLRYMHTTALPMVKSAAEESADGFDALDLSMEAVIQEEERLEAAMSAAATAAPDLAAIFRDQATAAAELAQQLKGASDAQIAEAAISMLREELDKGTITTAEFSQAVQETQLAFGLADEKSLALQEGLFDLVERFADGTVKAGEFDESLASLIQRTERETLQAELLKQAIDALPSEKVIRVRVEYQGATGYLPSDVYQPRPAPRPELPGRPSNVPQSTVNTNVTINNYGMGNIPEDDVYLAGSFYGGGG